MEKQLSLGVGGLRASPRGAVARPFHMAMSGPGPVLAPCTGGAKTADPFSPPHGPAAARAVFIGEQERRDNHFRRLIHTEDMITQGVRFLDYKTFHPNS